MRAGDDLQAHPVPLVLAGVERPVPRYPVDRDQGAVDDHVGVAGLFDGADGRLQPGGAPGGASTSLTYRQAVVVLTANPAASAVNVSPFFR